MSTGWWFVTVALAACSGGSNPDPDPDGPIADDAPATVCVGATYDPCTDNTQCTGGNCHLFMMFAIQVCTAPCTPGDNTTCPVDINGAPGFCSGMGICKPDTANDCTR